MTTLADSYTRTFHAMHRDLHDLRAQRKRAETAEARERAEMAIDRKQRELLTLRHEAWERAGVVL